MLADFHSFENEFSCDSERHGVLYTLFTVAANMKWPDKFLVTTILISCLCIYSNDPDRPR